MTQEQFYTEIVTLMAKYQADNDSAITKDKVEALKDIHILLEHGGRVDGERGASFIAQKRLDRIVIKKVQNFEPTNSKLWTA